MTEIKKIIKGCLAGDRRDQELLYRRYASKLYAVCLQYSGNDEEARDILQEGFIKIFGLPSKIYNKVNKEKFAKVKKVLKRKK